MITSKKTLFPLAIFMLVLSAWNSAAFAKQMTIEAAPSAVEESLLYQRFNTATDLYKEGKYNEAADILRYILTKDPENEHVRSYLERVVREEQIHSVKHEKEILDMAASIKRKKLDSLIRDGIDYYNAKDFDSALLKFSETQALDPENNTAKNYLEKLKKHYLAEARVDGLVQNWSNNATSVSPKNAKEQRVADFLKQAELEQRLGEILNIKKLEEIRSEHFILGPGDIIQIDVSGHPELTGMVSIRIDGDIMLPYVHDSIMAKGLIVEELDEKIKTALENYIQDPQVDVSEWNIRAGFST